MRRLNLVWTLLFLALGAMLTSCDSNRVYEEYSGIPDYQWDRKHIVRFEVNITDTLNPHNLYVNIRNSGKYPNANLWLFIRTIAPEGEVVRDTVECILADESGRWLGSGIGDVFDSSFPLKQGVIFPASGTYVFEYEQGMRKEMIQGIMDVGLRVERAEK